MVGNEELKQYENLIKSNGFLPVVKNKCNGYIYSNRNDKRSIAFILMLCFMPNTN